uniref:Uncharacterized protein n=1 Tax=Physcomitrium patens TaxID=3218 RepID=A0A2K1L0J8_PHYPA|nr:hypothetical protein PHYPA_002342 [Physcomitrium patens]
MGNPAQFQCYSAGRGSEKRTVHNWLTIDQLDIPDQLLQITG